VVEEIAYDEPNEHSWQSQSRRLSGGKRRGPWALNGAPVAPHGDATGVLKRPPKIEGGHFGLSRRTYRL
jgi:hypothetical protein